MSRATYCTKHYARHKWIGDTCVNCGVGWHVFAGDRIKEADSLEKKNEELREAMREAYNALPTTADPEAFINEGAGNWGLTEIENKVAVILATALCKP